MKVQKLKEFEGSLITPCLTEKCKTVKIFSQERIRKLKKEDRFICKGCGADHECFDIIVSQWTSPNDKSKEGYDGEVPLFRLVKGE